MDKLLSKGGFVPSSPFHGRFFGKLDSKIPPPPISEKDMERFSEVPI